MRKIGILGGGNVGATAAFVAIAQDIGDVAIYDIQEGVPAGKALDMTQAGPVLRYDGRAMGSHDPAVLAGSNVVIVTAGFPRKPGMGRMDLLKKNTEIAKSAGEIIRLHAPDAVVVTVTNPLDVMTWVIWQSCGFEPSRVIGMAGILDSARFSAFIATELQVPPREVEAMVLGGHGPSMVPLPRFTTVGGIPVTELLPQDRIDAFIERTRKGGAEIVQLLGTGSAFYAPGASAVRMAEAVLKNSGLIVPCSVWAFGSYGLRDVYVGLPAQLGAKGVQRIVELNLNEDELAALHKSAETVAAGIEEVKGLGLGIGS